MKKKIIGGITLGLLGVFSLASCNLTITDNTKNQDQTDSGSDSDTKTETFTITFDSKGGSSVTSQTVKKGNKATKPTDPTRSGYTFAGWYKEEAYTNEFNFETTTITYDRTLYAKWTQNSSGGGESTTQYTVTFNANGHGTAPAAQIISKGGKITKPTDPTATGYTFVGWYKEASCINSWNFSTDTVSGATTLYAKWTQNTTPTTNYTVTFNVNGHGTAPSSQTIVSGGMVTKPTDPSADNYTFVGWYKEAACTNAWNFSTDTVTSTTTLYAKWTQNSSSGELTITNTVGYNEAIYFTFNPASGHTNSTDYTVLYKKSSETESSYTSINSELVRINNGTGRADILGLTPSNYDIKIQSPYGTKEVKNIEVVAQDRSGYAHFGYTSGIGAYNDDGTLKTGTTIYYVTEDNKNNVDGNNNSIVNILKNASGPLCIRILGRIGAATWNSPTYAPSEYDAATTSTIRGNNGSYLALQNYDESDIISGGFNSLNTSTYSKLNGLTNKIKYDSSKKEFDSYYNMADISNKSNITVEGIGEDAEIFQWGFTWKNCSSIEVKNITFSDYTEDACSFEASTSDKDLTSYSAFTSKNIWVHNNTFNIGKNYWDVCSEQDKHDGDGATDFKRQAFVTLSYNRYNNNHKTGLVGGGDTQITAAITFHHNYYNQCQSRLPFARQANMHMYNNFYNASSNNNMQIYAGAYAFIENCYFKNVSKTFTLSNEYFKTNDSSYQSGKTYYTKSNNVYTVASISEFASGTTYYERRIPAVKSYNNIFDGCGNYSQATIVTSRTETVPNGNLFNPTFDTSTTDFYYDATNQKSKVSIMNNASDLPTLIPSVAGAGLCAKLTY